MGYTPPYLNVTGTADITIRPPGSGWVKMYGTLTDTHPVLFLYPGQYAKIVIANTTYFSIDDHVVGEFFKFTHVNPDSILENPIANKNIYLKTTGTGVVKFGSYTAGAATDSTGYITILDAAGNTRKLMVQA